MPSCRIKCSRSLHVRCARGCSPINQCQRIHLGILGLSKCETALPTCRSHLWLSSFLADINHAVEYSFVFRSSQSPNTMLGGPRPSSKVVSADMWKLCNWNADFRSVSSDMPRCPPIPPAALPQLQMSFVICRHHLPCPRTSVCVCPRPFVVSNPARIGIRKCKAVGVGFVVNGRSTCPACQPYPGQRMQVTLSRGQVPSQWGHTGSSTAGVPAHCAPFWFSLSTCDFSRPPQQIDPLLPPPSRRAASPHPYLPRPNCSPSL